MGLAVLIPLVVFLLWFATSAGFREFALSLNPGILTFVQSWRIAGLAFLALYTVGLLPGVLALPAGWGDIAIGATAPLAALKLATFRRRRSFILWQVLGIFDLVTAVTVGTTARWISPNEVGTGLMTVLPLSLIPTFAVPLLMMLHIICIAALPRPGNGGREWTRRLESSCEQWQVDAYGAKPRSMVTACSMVSLLESPRHDGSLSRS